MAENILDILDSEMLKIVALHRELNEMAAERRHNYADFERMIREKFAEIGFTVDVNWYEFALDGRKQDGAMPEITVTGRTDTAFRFDPDRQVHEAVHDVLGLGEGGWIKTDPDTLKRFTEGQEGHTAMDTPTDVNNKAAAFAKEHGSFSLHFDADQNYVRPDDVPWSLELHGHTPEWGGLTAEEAIDFAENELAAARLNGGTPS